MSATYALPELPDGVTFTDDPMPMLRISTAAAQARVALQGAHLTHWQPAGQDPVLWTSSATRWEQGTAIRGGIPVCFPWFGPGRTDFSHPDPLAPAHGWARVVEWSLLEAEVDDDGTAQLIFELPDHQNQPHAEQLPADASLRYTLRIGAGLDLTLEIIAGDILVDVEAAWHTYLAVSDIDETRVEGLDQVGYLDKVSGENEVQQGEVTFAGQVDRVYDASSGVSVVTPHRRLEISTSGTGSTIVWNPGEQKAATMSDVGAGEWRRFACVESGNVLEHAAIVPPGHQHVMRVSYRLT